MSSQAIKLVMVAQKVLGALSRCKKVLGPSIAGTSRLCSEPL
jgi:hypothetical protein